MGWKGQLKDTVSLSGLWVFLCDKRDNRENSYGKPKSVSAPYMGINCSDWSAVFIKLGELSLKEVTACVSKIPDRTGLFKSSTDLVITVREFIAGLSSEPKDNLEEMQALVEKKREQLVPLKAQLKDLEKSVPNYTNEVAKAIKPLMDTWHRIDKHLTFLWPYAQGNWAKELARHYYPDNVNSYGAVIGCETFDLAKGDLLSITEGLRGLLVDISEIQAGIVKAEGILAKQHESCKAIQQAHKAANDTHKAANAALDEIAAKYEEIAKAAKTEKDKIIEEEETSRKEIENKIMKAETELGIITEMQLVFYNCERAAGLEISKNTREYLDIYLKTLAMSELLEHLSSPSNELLVLKKYIEQTYENAIRLLKDLDDLVIELEPLQKNPILLNLTALLVYQPTFSKILGPGHILCRYEKDQSALADFQLMQDMISKKVPKIHEITVEVCTLIYVLTPAFISQHKEEIDAQPSKTDMLKDEQQKLEDEQQKLEAQQKALEDEQKALEAQQKALAKQLETLRSPQQPTM